MSDPTWVPTFEYAEDHWVVHFGGRDWWLITAPDLQTQGLHQISPFGYLNGSIWDRAELRFQMMLIPPPPDPSIPDNIVLGEN